MLPNAVFQGHKPTIFYVTDSVSIEPKLCTSLNQIQLSDSFKAPSGCAINCGAVPIKVAWLPLDGAEIEDRGKTYIAVAVKIISTGNSDYLLL